MGMNKIGEKFISGKIVSLDDEKIEKLEEIVRDLKSKEKEIKNNIDIIIQ
jgi:hypothetical protein